MHDKCAFVTLTYADDPRLSKRDLQLFFKRLRKAGREFRYFAVGELGRYTRRAHAHVLFFGEDFLDTAVDYSETSEKLYVSRELEQAWGLGGVDLRPMEVGAAFYVAGDAVKNFGAESFVMYSKRPYLGAAYADAFFDDFNRLNFCTIDGVRYPVPRSYLRRPELRSAFAPLRAKRREFVGTVSMEDVAELERTSRSRRINHEAAVDRRRGKL